VLCTTLSLQIFPYAISAIGNTDAMCRKMSDVIFLGFFGKEDDMHVSTTMRGGHAGFYERRNDSCCTVASLPGSSNILSWKNRDCFMSGKSWEVEISSGAALHATAFTTTYIGVGNRKCVEVKVVVAYTPRTYSSGRCTTIQLRSVWQIRPPCQQPIDPGTIVYPL
jgi:hypothetical protein